MLTDHPEGVPRDTSSRGLPLGRVGVWYVRTREVSAAALAATRAILTAEEQQRWSRFLFEKNKHEFLVTRALERGVLATCLGKRPAELAFVRNDYGRPALSPAVPLRFNLTNTLELVACAVTSDREVGVDTEPLARADTVIEVAPTVFRDTERAMLDRLDLPARRRRAVELWTLKEAYMKARGMGMSLPVQEFEIHYGTNDEPELRVHDTITDDPSRWVLTTRQVGDHLVGLCVERRAGELDVAIEHADLDAMLSDSRSSGQPGS